MPNYKLTIAYDGTDFHGWQQQENASSIQQIIKKALDTVLRHSTRLIGSGRTDAGVHARGQVAHFHSSTPLKPARVLYSLNALLPATIRLLALEEVSEAFHAQYSAKGKTYHYHLFLGSVMPPTKRLYTWKPFHVVDLLLMKEAAAYFIGTHDFTTFTNKGSASEDPVRTIYSITFVPEEGGVALIFHGSGFLYKMVRNIVGTLVAAGAGRLVPRDIPLLLAKRDRRVAPEGAPPQGLFLHEVHY